MQDFRLNVFYAVASHLSFTKAANELFITQPAVTKNIKELETEYAIRLFERKGNKIILTTAGKILLTYTEQIRELYQRASFDLNLLNDKYSGQIKLGASTTIGQYILPPLLAKFYQSFPDFFLQYHCTVPFDYANLILAVELFFVVAAAPQTEKRAFSLALLAKVLPSSNYQLIDLFAL